MRREVVAAVSPVGRGVHLKDLILLHTALPDWVDDIYVNFRKMVQLSMIFTELMQVQNATLPIEPNMDLVNTVRVRSSVSRLSSVLAQFFSRIFRIYEQNHRRPSFSGCRLTDLELTTRHSCFGINTAVVPAPIENFFISTILYLLAL